MERVGTPFPIKPLFPLFPLQALNVRKVAEMVLVEAGKYLTSDEDILFERKLDLFYKEPALPCGASKILKKTNVISIEAIR